MPRGRPPKSFQESGYVIQDGNQYQAAFQKQSRVLRGPYRESREAAQQDVAAVRREGRDSCEGALRSLRSACIFERAGNM